MENERNQAFIRQIMKMYQALDKAQNASEPVVEAEVEKLSEKGHLEAPL